MEQQRFMKHRIIIIIVTLLACGAKFVQLHDRTELSDRVYFSRLSPKQATALFDTLAALDFIEFRYANNHCEDRAHAMSYLIAEKGIKAGKAWIFVRNIFEKKYPKVLKIYDQNHPKPKGLLTWKYHVAPVVMTTAGDTLVLDPSLCTEPVTLRQWFEKMNVEKDVTENDIFFLIKDWKWQTYKSVDKRGRLFEPWRTDEDFEMTKQGLCEGRICQQFLLENPRDSVHYVIGKAFTKLPPAYKTRKKECLKELNSIFRPR